MTPGGRRAHQRWLEYTDRSSACLPERSAKVPGREACFRETSGHLSHLEGNGLPWLTTTCQPAKSPNSVLTNGKQPIGLSPLGLE